MNCPMEAKCIYHPENPDKIKNKCDLRKGVIWKRSSPVSPFTYGSKYIDIVKTELLDGKTMPLEPLLSLFYPDRTYDEAFVDEFRSDFHFKEDIS